MNNLFLWNQLSYKQCLLLLPYKHEAFVEIVWHQHGSSVSHLSTLLCIISLLSGYGDPIHYNYDKDCRVGQLTSHLSTRLKLRLAQTCRRFVKTLEHGWFWSLWSWFKASMTLIWQHIFFGSYGYNMGLSRIECEEKVNFTYLLNWPFPYSRFGHRDIFNESHSVFLPLVYNITVLEGRLEGLNSLSASNIKQKITFIYFL